MRCIWLVGILIWSGAATVWAEFVTLTPVRDTTLFEHVSGTLSNGSGPNLFAGDNSDLLTRRALLAFDVAGAVPAGARIDRVTLYLFMSNSPDTTVSTTLALHSVRTSWGEGASTSTGGAGAPAAVGDATWIHRFYPDSLWSERGGDFEAAPVVAFGVRRLGPYNISSTAMLEDVQRWHDRPELAFGWLMNGEEDTASSARRFDSREHPDLGHRPKLVVEYTVTPVAPATWSDVKGLFKE